ncbi:MAG: hypothetical protein ACRC32_28320 [Chroococcidiopsis sp.]
MIGTTMTVLYADGWRSHFSCWNCGGEGGWYQRRRLANRICTRRMGILRYLFGEGGFLGMYSLQE